MKNRIKFLAGWGLALFALVTHTVFFVCGLLVMAVFSKTGERRIIAGLSALSLLPVAGIAVMVIINRVLRKKNLDAGYRVRGTALLLLVLNSVFLLSDARPLKNDYCEDHLQQPADAGLSFKTLKSLTGRGLVRLAPEQLEAVKNAPETPDILADAKDIRKAWKASKRARALLGELDLFDGIADFSHVDDSAVLAFSDFAVICACHEAYARLLFAGGDAEGAEEILAPLHSVARKALPYASLGNKSWWLAVCRRNFRFMGEMAFSPYADSRLRERILRDFPPLSPEELSFENALIGHYLLLKRFVEMSFGREQFISLLAFPVEPDLGRWEKLYNITLSRVIYPVTVDRNRIVRDLRAYCDLLIETASSVPPDARMLKIFRNNYHRRPQLGNLAGWITTRQTMHNTEMLFEAMAVTKVLGDLLAVEISGKTGNITDVFSGKNFLRDSGDGRFYSVGSDRTAGTEDDIRLRKTDN